MEFLVPLLIFGIGIAFSAVQSAQESKKKQKRNIDLDKLERPKPKNTPLPKQKPMNNENQAENGKSIWQTLVDDFKEEYQKLEQEEQQKQRKEQPRQTTERQPYSPKQQSKRLEQDMKNALERSKTAARQTARRTEERTRKRPEVAKPDVHVAEVVESNVKVDKPVEGVTKNSKKPNVHPTFDVGNISFDEKAFVNGVIMNEILGPPKSRQKRR